MNIVILKHREDGRQYLFEVPAGKTLEKGDRVLARSKGGFVDGICTCDSFEAANNVVEAMHCSFGCKLPLAPVVGKYNLESWQIDGDADSGDS